MEKRGETAAFKLSGIVKVHLRMRQLDLPPKIVSFPDTCSCIMIDWCISSALAHVQLELLHIS